MRVFLAASLCLGALLAQPPRPRVMPRGDGPAPSPAGGAGLSRSGQPGQAGQPAAGQAMQGRAAAEELKPEDYGLISGQVTSAADGSPLRKATLTLRSTDNVRRGAPQSASTGDGGVFLFSNVTPGRYKIHIERNGYVGQDYGARRPAGAGVEVRVEKGGRVTGLQAKLQPHGVITGHVRDEDGEPMAGVRVQVFRWGYQNGNRTLMPLDGDSTDDRGEYRVYGVAPGKYVVSASSQRGGFRPDGGNVVPASPEQRGNDEAYLPIYYPGTFELSQAATTDVAAGATLQGIDFNMRKVKTVRVTGRVLRASSENERGRPVMVMLLAKGATLMNMNALRAMTSSNGSFEVRGVRPGSYILHADEFDRNSRLTADVPIEVGPGGLDNLTVPLAPGMEVKGKLTLEDSPDTKLASIGVWLRGKNSPAAGGPFSGGMNARLAEDGTFTIPAVTAGEYEVSVAGLPEGFYLKSIRAGEQEAYNTALHILPGAPPAIQIVARPNAGSVAGSVKNREGQPVAGSTVVLWPTTKNARSVLFKSATTDAQGNFTISSVPPGDYRLAAFEFLEPGASQDPEFLQGFESKAEKVSVQENARETRSLVELVNET